MDAADIAQRLRNKLEALAVPEDLLDGAIYQDMGINGLDFYDLLCDIEKDFPLPEFEWSDFADMSEPPDGLTFLRLFTGRGPKILSRKRLTVFHLSKVIAEGHWSEP